MNVNKVQLGMELSLKQQTALKCMEFATQYLLKKAQYRLLNPLHSSLFNLTQLNKNSQVMAQLSQYSTSKPFLTNKILNDNNPKPQQIQFIPYSPQTQIKPSKINPKQKQKPNIIPQQHQPKPQSSVSQYDHLQFQRTSSQIINNRSSQQSITSKKNKSKFQKIVKSNKKPQSQTFPQQNFNFKKIKSPQIQKKSSKQIDLQMKKSKQNNSQMKKSSQIKIQSNKKFDNKFSDSDSDDSFENFPLPSQQKQKNYQKEVDQQSIKSEDLKSYRSSISSEKKVIFDVVSQHPSQQQISMLNESQIFLPHEKILNEESKTDKIKSDNIKRSNKIKTQQISTQTKIKQKTDDQPFSKKNQQNFEEQVEQIHDQKGMQKNDNQSQMLMQQQRQKEESLNQIRKHLLKLQSFDVQQQILMKKILKTWTKDSPVLNNLKNIQWSQLNLPKPSFKFNTNLYAQVIE